MSLGWSELNLGQALPSLDNGRLFGSHMSYNTPTLLLDIGRMLEENHTRPGHPPTARGRLQRSQKKDESVVVYACNPDSDDMGRRPERVTET